MTSWRHTSETSWRRSTETSLGVSFVFHLFHWDVSRDVAATSPRRLLAGWGILSEQPSLNLLKSLSISQGVLMLKKNKSCLIEQLTVIALFTAVILFILCELKSQLYFAVGKKKTLICYFYYFLAGLHPPRNISSKNC